MLEHSTHPGIDRVARFRVCSVTAPPTAPCSAVNHEHTMTLALFLTSAAAASFTAADTILVGETAPDVGIALAINGDSDGDGRDDLLFGDPLAGGGNGSAAILSGGSGGIIGWSGADADITGEAAGDQFGSAVAWGDINGDGLADAVVGAPKADPSGLTSAGTVYVFYGPLSGSLLATNADVILNGAAAGDAAGSALSVADYDGDSLADIAIGAPGNDAGGVGAGGVYLVGGAALLSGSLATIPEFYGTVGEALGYTLAAGGDVDASGDLELLAGSPFDGDAGVAYVILDAAFAASGPIAAVSTTLDGAALYDRTGDALAGLGAWNNDVYDDFAVGAPGHDGTAGTNTGWVFVVKGGTGFVPGAVYSLAAIAGILEGVQANDWAGSSLAGVGDLFGSSKDDLLVGVPYGGAYGYACLVKGQPLVVGVPQLLAGPVVKGTSAVGMVGWAVAGGGDLSGTSDLDFVVSGWATATSANVAAEWWF